MTLRHYGWVTVGVLVFATTAFAAKPAQDRIEVAGHIALSNGPVTRLMATEHYGECYLYAEHAGSRMVTVIDVTGKSQPTVVSEFNFPANARDGLVAVAGTEAVVENGPESSGPPRSIAVMDLSDPEHPAVQREFTGVTAVDRDSSRGLIFLANADGVWILQQHLAEDPAMVKAYDNYVLYNR